MKFYDNLKSPNSKPILPFQDSRLLNSITHSMWFLPSVSACFKKKYFGRKG